MGGAISKWDFGIGKMDTQSICLLFRLAENSTQIITTEVVFAEINKDIKGVLKCRQQQPIVQSHRPPHTHPQTI